MKEKYIAPSVEVVVWTGNEEVATLSNTNGSRNGTNVLASWLIGE